MKPIFSFFALVMAMTSFSNIAKAATAMDPLNLLLANEKNENKVEEQVANLDDEDVQESSSEGLWERSNDPISLDTSTPEATETSVSSADDL